MNKVIKFIRHLVHEVVVHMVPSFMRKNMLSCQDVAFILSSEDDLSLPKRVKLKLHLMICQCCTDYETQLKIINQKAYKAIKLELTPEQEAKIKKSQEELVQKFTKK